MVFCCLFDVLMYKAGDNFFLANILEALGDPTLLCVLGSRMLINLKEAGERGVNEGTSYKMTSVSGIEFS